MRPEWLYREEPRDLPNRIYVTWTEAVTWIVAGDCWDDDYIVERNSAAWGNPTGPAWLIMHLRWMEQGAPAQLEEFGPGGRRLLLQFEEAKRWCETHGWDSDTALHGVNEACREYETLNAEFDRCDQVIIEACLRDEFEVFGCVRHPTTGVTDEMPRKIDLEYFMLPVRHAKGKGELSGIPPASDILLNTFIERQPRPTYEKVMFERARVPLIKSRYLKSGSRLKDGDSGSEGRSDREHDQSLMVLPNPSFVKPRGFSQSKLERWYKEVWLAERKRCALARTPSERDDWEAAKQAVSEHVTRVAIRALRKRYAPPEWKRPGARASESRRKESRR